MKKTVFLAIFIFFLYPSFLTTAQQNPFLSNTDSTSSEETKQNVQPGNFNYNVYNSSFMQKVKTRQKELQNKISSFITEYRISGNRTTLTTFLAFSFLYGLLHVLGPGHRKIFLFTYFVSRPAKWKGGMIAGFMTAVLHAFSAVVLVGGLYFITEKTLFRRFNDINPIMEKISYSLIVLIGLYLIVHELVKFFKTSKAEEYNNKNPDTIIFVIASGMVPCPGAATIMIFAIAVGSPLVGIYSVLAMSLGMAVVLTFIPPVAISLQSKLLPMAAKWKPETGEIIHSIFSITAALFLVLLGLFFLL